MKVYKWLYLILAVSILGCGPIKTKFGPDELAWFDVYNEGDTLIFRSQSGELDSSFIIKKERYYSDVNVYPGRKYWPEWGVIWYKNKHLTNHPDGYRLLTIEKKTPDDNTFMDIDYLYSSLLFLNEGVKHIKQKIKDDIYELDTSHPKAPPHKPKTILWHVKFGIVKYITHDDVVWERINIKARM
jgi:hypothetical protein